MGGAARGAAVCAFCSDECALPYTVLLRGYGDPVCCHIYHAHCIEPWWRKARTCPECGETFTAVGQVGDVQYLPDIEERVAEDQEADLLAHIRAQLRANGADPETVELEGAADIVDVDPVIDPIGCDVCRQTDRWDEFLVCDQCGAGGAHLDCLGLLEVPDGEWVCAACTLPTPTPPTALASTSRAPPAAPSREALRHRARRKREREAQGEAAYRRRSADERAARRLAAKLRERERADEETE